MPYTWGNFFFSARISWGTQVCVEHKGEHVWEWLDASNGWCRGVFSSRFQARFNQLREERACQPPPG